MKTGFVKRNCLCLGFFLWNSLLAPNIIDKCVLYLYLKMLSSYQPGFSFQMVK